MQPSSGSSGPHASATPATDATAARVDRLVTALVVDSALTNALSTVALLVANHFHVTVADTFERAKERLTERPPALLVTELRLREYNGLQLVLRGKSRRPDMAAIVLSNVPDAVLQAETEAMGATFVLTPVDSKDLAAAAFRTLLRGAPGTTAEPIRPPFERRARERRALQLVPPSERRTAERRRDIASLLQLVADDMGDASGR